MKLCRRSQSSARNRTYSVFFVIFAVQVRCGRWRNGFASSLLISATAEFERARGVVARRIVHSERMDFEAQENEEQVAVAGCNPPAIRVAQANLRDAN